MGNNFRVGSIYYDDDKKFYLLITSKSDDTIYGYSSRYDNPNPHDRFMGYHTEKIGVFDFDGIRIAFGNTFRKTTTKDDFPKLAYVKSLQKCEFQSFKMMYSLIINKQLVYQSLDGRARAIR